MPIDYGIYFYEIAKMESRIGNAKTIYTHINYVYTQIYTHIL